jgi:hypothetical protein
MNLGAKRFASSWQLGKAVVENEFRFQEGRDVGT